MAKYRALEMFARLPAGCILHPVLNDDSIPHLRPGEHAVVDTTDTGPQSGELYVIKYSLGTPRERRAIVQLSARRHTGPEGDFIGWWSGPLVRPGSAAECEAWMRQGRELRMIDGPRLAEEIEKALVGRVIGILQ
jgi:hypothetical protein